MITPQTFRFALDPDLRQALSNPADGQPFRMWKGNHTRFELGIFAGSAVRDISNLVTISVEVDVSQTSALPPLMYKEIAAEDFDLTLDAESWADGSKAHARIAFTGTECNLDLGGEKSKTFWLVIWGATDEGEIVTLGFGQLTVENDNAGTAGVPPATGPTYYTQEQANALFPQAYRAEIDWATVSTVDVVIPDPMLVESIHLSADLDPNGVAYNLGTPADPDGIAADEPALKGVVRYSVNEIITGGALRLGVATPGGGTESVGHIIVKGVKL